MGTIPRREHRRAGNTQWGEASHRLLTAQGALALNWERSSDPGVEFRASVHPPHLFLTALEGRVGGGGQFFAKERKKEYREALDSWRAHQAK